MKAVTYYEHGESDVLRYEDQPAPSAGPGEVVIRVGAVGVNPGPDIEARRIGFGTGAEVFPIIGGIDPAGSVVELGAGVADVSIGDRVAVYPVIACGECDMCRAGKGENYCRAFTLFGVQSRGGRADFAVAPASQLVALPDTVSDVEAAALGVAYTTTWHGIVSRGGLSADDTLLVMGAGGGCGVAAIQIGKLFGARVIGLTGPQWKMDRLKELGADEVVSYRDEDWPAQVRELTGGRGVSIAFDNAGADTLKKSISCLDRAGRLVCSGGTSGLEVDLDLRVLYRNHLSLLFYVQGAKADMETLVELTGKGKLSPLVDETFPMDRAAEADDKVTASNQLGRIVLVNE